MTFNAYQVRALRSTAIAVDRLLAEIEGLATQADSPLRGYVDDLAPAQKQLLVAFARAVHTRMTTGMAQLGIAPPAPSRSARTVAQVALTFADIALQEVEPRRLRGFGALPSSAETAVEGLLSDVAASLRAARECLTAPAGVDLARRIASLDDARAEKPELARIERVVRENGLVALRRPLQALVEQVESGTYEIAVFGRVSSGKSSLLNALLERPILPVGITPVTSLATRLVWGVSPSVAVSLASDPHPRRLSVGELEEFVTEQHNAGNAKKVERITVEVPAPRLRAGVALVDTPGLGALATSGARETYAYMPRCDLGVVVVDGGGALDLADLEIARVLVDSGIEVAMILTKADRVAEPDRAALARYVQAELRARLGVDMQVPWVSSAEPHAAQARAWFDDALAPRIARARELAAESLARKLKALGALLQRASVPSSSGALGAEAVRAIESVAREVAALLEQRERVFDDALPRPREVALVVLRAAAASLGRVATARAGEAVRDALMASAAQERASLHRWLLETRDEVRAQIDRCVRAAGVDLDRDAVSLDLTAMPALEVPDTLAGLTVRVPRFGPWRERRIAERLAVEAGERVESSLRQLDGRLRDWVRSALRQLLGQFASQVDPLRAPALVAAVPPTPCEAT